MIEVSVRRARKDVVGEQQKAFELLSQLKYKASENNDQQTVSTVEDLGRQLVRILLDRQDKDQALSFQIQDNQEVSIQLIDDISEQAKHIGREWTKTRYS